MVCDVSLTKTGLQCSPSAYERCEKLVFNSHFGPWPKETTKEKEKRENNAK
ncbi:hypothetical protein ACSS6W_000614 [Trichoderma asperelloides]